jgi:hypothetical protein
MKKQDIRGLDQRLINSFINGSTAFVGPWPLIQFRNLFYIGGRSPQTSDQPVARPLPTHRTTQTQNKLTHRHPGFEWNCSPRTQCSSERRWFMPYTARQPWSADQSPCRLIALARMICSRCGNLRPQIKQRVNTESSTPHSDASIRKCGFHFTLEERSRRFIPGNSTC